MRDFVTAAESIREAEERGESVESMRVRVWGGPIMPALLFGIITQSEHKA